jgi:SAM-dependent methyltransferase
MNYYNILICPKCSESKLILNSTNLECTNCKSKFYREGEFVDFVGKINIDNHTIKVLELWGNDLHFSPLNVTPHYLQIENIFSNLWKQSLKGKILEIGCGSGSDTYSISSQNSSISLISFDIGENVYQLSKILINTQNVCLLRANALSIPFSRDSFNMVYSFGVFHHTINPPRCFNEAFRVLKKEGVLFFYVYSYHEDNLFKYSGILIENLLMKFLERIPKYLYKPFFYLLSIQCLIVFSWPSLLLTKFGFKSLAIKIPMYWGTTPNSIIPDLKDRLLAPANYRFKYDELQNLLNSICFQNIMIKKTSSGLYGYCVK